MTHAETTAQPVGDAEGGDAPPAAWPRIFTWRAPSGDLMESVRVQLNGSRIKAYGRIIGAADQGREAFNASYDVVTDEQGNVKRLSIHCLTVSGDAQLSIARDGENRWLLNSAHGATRAEYSDISSVDMVNSAFFNAFAIRAHDLHSQPGAVDVSTVYVDLPSLKISECTVQYTATATGISVISPTSSSTISVDQDGFVIDYPGLTARV